MLHYLEELLGRGSFRFDRLTIPLTLPFLRSGDAARDKLVKYRTILETLDEIERHGPKGGA